MTSPQSPEFQRLLQQLEDLINESQLPATSRALAREHQAKRLQLERKLSELLRPHTGGGPERRTSVRVGCHLPGWVSVDGGLRANVQVLDVSGGGVRLESALRPGAGVRVEVGLLPQAELLGDELILTGQVAWANPTAFGVAFTDVNAATERTLLRLVLRLIRAGRLQP